MAQIVTGGNKLQAFNTVLEVPAMEVPSFRFQLAKQENLERNFLIEVWGGIGDVICAEPAVRWGCKNYFPDHKISLETWYPDFFNHLPLTKVYDTALEQADKSKYWSMKSIYTNETLHWEFIGYAVTQRVDYCSLALWRRQLPVADRCIELHPTPEQMEKTRALIPKKGCVAIHPGQSWPSRTMSPEWWNKVVSLIREKGVEVLVIGKNMGDYRSTVAIDPTDCIDLRNHLSVMESVALLQQVPCFLTNDSSPHHMAASGKAWIGFLSTVNHPDHLTHWRNGGEWGWRMKNFAKGGMWQLKPLLITEEKAVTMNEVEKTQLESWLPEPMEIATWAVEKSKCEI